MTINFFKHDATAKILFILYIILFIWGSIRPFDRVDWWAENIPIVAVFLTLVILYVKGIRLTATAYALMSVLLCLHTIGGHYTFERVPFSFVDNLFGFKRNMYDRFAHFSVGLYAYAFTELLVLKKSVNSKLVLFLYPIFAVAFIAMSYELLEWWFAVSYGGDSGANFLGSQGDIWDAQKDMLCDTLGGIFATLLYFWYQRPKLK